MDSIDKIWQINAKSVQCVLQKKDTYTLVLLKCFLEYDSYLIFMWNITCNWEIKYSVWIECQKHI